MGQDAKPPDFGQARVDYPVLFTMQLGVGMVFDSFGLEFEEPTAGTTTSGGPSSLVDFADASLGLGGIPVNYEFRIHRNHLMAQFGIQWSFATDPRFTYQGDVEGIGMTECELGYCDVYPTDLSVEDGHGH